MTPARPVSPYDLDCPRCSARPGEQCTNPITGKPYKSNAPHLERVKATRKANHP